MDSRVTIKTIPTKDYASKVLTDRMASVAIAVIGMGYLEKMGDAKDSAPAIISVIAGTLLKPYAGIAGYSVEKFLASGLDRVLPLKASHIISNIAGKFIGALPVALFYNGIGSYSEGKKEASVLDKALFETVKWSIVPTAINAVVYGENKAVYSELTYGAIEKFSQETAKNFICSKGVVVKDGIMAAEGKDKGANTLMIPVAAAVAGALGTANMQLIKNSLEGRVAGKDLVKDTVKASLSGGLYALDPNSEHANKLGTIAESLLGKPEQSILGGTLSMALIETINSYLAPWVDQYVDNAAEMYNHTAHTSTLEPIVIV